MYQSRVKIYNSHYVYGQVRYVMKIRIVAVIKIVTPSYSEQI